MPPVRRASSTLAISFFGIDGRKAQVEDAFDGDGQADHQAQQHRKHPFPTAFEELLHQHMVEALAFEPGLDGRLDDLLLDNLLGFGSGGILCEHIHSTQRKHGH